MYCNWSTTYPKSLLQKYQFVGLNEFLQWNETNTHTPTSESTYKPTNIAKVLMAGLCFFFLHRIFTDKKKRKRVFAIKCMEIAKASIKFSSIECLVTSPAPQISLICSIFKESFFFSFVYVWLFIRRLDKHWVTSCLRYDAYIYAE